MSQFVISYIGGNKPSSPEEGMAQMTKYKAWLSGLGEAVVSPANPFGNTHTVNSDGSVVAGSTSSMSGYSIVEADSLDDAISMVKDCPFLEMCGVLEVSELMQSPF